MGTRVAAGRATRWSSRPPISPTRAVSRVSPPRICTWWSATRELVPRPFNGMSPSPIHPPGRSRGRRRCSCGPRPIRFSRWLATRAMKAWRAPSAATAHWKRQPRPRLEVRRIIRASSIRGSARYLAVVDPRCQNRAAALDRSCRLVTSASRGPALQLEDRAPFSPAPIVVYTSALDSTTTGTTKSDRKRPKGKAMRHPGRTVSTIGLAHRDARRRARRSRARSRILSGWLRTGHRCLRASPGESWPMPTSTPRAICGCCIGRRRPVEPRRLPETRVAARFRC